MANCAFPECNVQSTGVYSAPQPRGTGRKMASSLGSKRHTQKKFMPLIVSFVIRYNEVD